MAEAAATARQSVGEGTDTAAAGAGIAARAGTCCSKARSPAPSSFAPSEAPPSCPPSAQRPCDVRRRTPGGTGHGSAGQGNGYAEGSFGRVGSRSRCSPEPWRPTSGRTGAVLAWAGGHSDVYGSFGRGSPLLGARRGRRGRAFWSQDSFVQGGDADGFIRCPRAGTGWFLGCIKGTAGGEEEVAGPRPVQLLVTVADVALYKKGRSNRGYGRADRDDGRDGGRAGWSGGRGAVSSGGRGASNASLVDGMKCRSTNDGRGRDADAPGWCRGRSQGTHVIFFEWMMEGSIW